MTDGLLSEDASDSRTDRLIELDRALADPSGQTAALPLGGDCGLAATAKCLALMNRVWHRRTCDEVGSADRGRGAIESAELAAAWARLIQPAQREPLLSGTLGPYVILEEVGSGGMGVVYRAYDHRRNRDVAVKTLCVGGPAAAMRIQQEFRVVTGVAHPNLVRLYELHSVGGRWFFSMEYVDGAPFLTHVRQVGRGARGGAPIQPGVPIGGGAGTEPVHEPMVAPGQYHALRARLVELASAVDALHQAGIVHRDIKPANVLVESTGRVVLLDFGLARLRSGAANAGTGHRTAGTLAYMAPELLAGGEPSFASDWYSVGTILYEALTGHLPYSGTAKVVRATKLLHGPPLRDLAISAPSQLCDLCEAWLQRDPARRPTGDRVLTAVGLNAKGFAS